MKGKFLLLLKILLPVLLVAIPVFGHLDTLPIRLWDESRLAINAHEMFHNGNLLVVHYEGTPEMWNTKPPLLIWCQAFFMKIIGANEIAIRLPSALAAFFTMAALLYFSIRYLHRYWFGLCAILVLLTSQGYINEHATRTGDYDAMLTLFTTCSALFLFSYFETSKRLYLFCFFFLSALGVLTKSITGVLFWPGLFIYALTQRKVLVMLKNKDFYIGLAVFLLLVVGYYALREVYNPGYFNKVYENELGGRYLNVTEHNEGPFDYYFQNLLAYRYSYWLVLLPFGILLGLFYKDRKIQKLTLFTTILLSTFFIIISNAQTKLEWYDVPMYPFMALLVAIVFITVFNYLQQVEYFNQLLRVNVIPFVFLLLVFFSPYKEIIAKTKNPVETGNGALFYEASYYLQKAARGQLDLHDQYFAYDGYNAHYLLYVRLLNEQGTNLHFQHWENLKDGTTVFASQTHIHEAIRNAYEYEILAEDGSIVTYRIIQKKQPIHY
jgi:4-amino-4-deoxy-L-arabinose transferase-like glycosyltransferase